MAPSLKNRWSDQARNLWYRYWRTTRNGLPTEKSTKFVRTFDRRADFFQRVIQTALNDGDLDLFYDIEAHLQHWTPGAFRTAGINLREHDRFMDTTWEIVQSFYDPDTVKELAIDLSAGALEHITSHSHKHHPVTDLAKPFIGEKAAGVIDVLQDAYSYHRGHKAGKHRWHEKQKWKKGHPTLSHREQTSVNPRHPKQIFNKRPITEPGNVFDVTQPGSLPLKKQKTMHGTPYNKKRRRSIGGSSSGSWILSTPRSVRSIARSTPRRVFARPPRFRRLRRYKRRNRFKKLKSGIRTPGVKKQFKKLKRKRGRNVKVSRRLARKIKKVIRGGLPNGRHIQIENFRWDPNPTNQIGWYSNGIRSIPSFDPSSSYSGEIFSPFEVLRKANELYMGKTLEQQNYACSATTDGLYDMVGGSNNTNPTANNLWPFNANDKQYGQIPILEVVKQYYKSEWTNQTQRPYYLEFYEIQSRKSGPHSIIGDPWTHYIKELDTTTLGGTVATNSTFGFVGPDRATYPGEQYMITSFTNSINVHNGTYPVANQTDLLTVDKTAYPIRPEWLPGWNKSWKFKKTRILLEPGQSYTYNVKGWTGKFNYRKLLSTGFGVTPINPTGIAYHLNGVQRSMNRWIMVGAYVDQVGTTTVGNVAVRAGRIDKSNTNGAFGLIFETTQVLKVKYPEQLLSTVPNASVDTGVGPWVAQDPNANTSLQGGTTPFSARARGHLLANTKRPKVVIYSLLDMRGFGVPAGEVNIGRIDETNPQTVETNPES